MAEQANDRFEGFKFYLCNAQHHPQWILCSLRCGSTEQEEISTTCRKKARSKHTHKAKTQVEEKHIQATPIILRMQIVKREKQICRLRPRSKRKRNRKNSHRRRSTQKTDNHHHHHQSLYLCSSPSSAISLSHRELPSLVTRPMPLLFCLPRTFWLP